MPTLTEYLDTDLTEAQVRAIAHLLNRTWPEHKTMAARIEDFYAEARRAEASGSERAIPRRYVIWEADRAIAHAKTFPRQIFTAIGPLEVMALAGVSVEAEQQGRGLGAAVARRAFGRVDRGAFPVSLFQTGVPGFYEKLGARLVTNPFVNRLDPEHPEANPWEDDHAMIYPAAFGWPDGEIDINGPAY